MKALETLQDEFHAYCDRMRSTHGAQRAERFRSDQFALEAWVQAAALAAQPLEVLPVPEQTLDTQRLDWLDKQRDLFFDCYMRDGKLTHIVRQHWGQALGYGPTPRAAIDAAIAAMKEPT